MSLGTRGESNDDRHAYPEGQIPNGKGQLVNDHWGDQPTNHQELRIAFLNIQTFPNSVTHHKNGCIIQLMNDNHIDCLGLA